MKYKAFKLSSFYSSGWARFNKEQNFLSRTNYGAINVESIFARIYEF